MNKLILTLLVCSVGYAQSKPPVVSVQMTETQQAEWGAANRDVEKAENILERAKQARERLEIKIADEDRTPQLPNPTCFEYYNNIQFDNWITEPVQRYYNMMDTQSRPNGYIGEIQDGWVVYTLKCLHIRIE